MAKTADRARDVLGDREHALRLLRLMVLVRRFEERAEEQYTRARIGGYCHLAIGEEAANVGSIDCLEGDDYLFVSYREQRLVHAIHEACHVLADAHDESGTRLRVRAPRALLDRFRAALAALPDADAGA